LRTYLIHLLTAPTLFHPEKHPYPVYFTHPPNKPTNPTPTLTAHPQNGSFAGTSKMLISNIAFINFTGYTAPSPSNNVSVVNDISCSKINKCFNIVYDNFQVVDPLAVVGKGKAGKKAGITTCQYQRSGGIQGVSCTKANSSCPLGACGQA